MAQLPRDILQFLQGYPDAEDDSTEQSNLQFYKNQRRCQPDELLIDEIHEMWAGRYDILEAKHGYIQWLFPIREYGMNYESQPLQEHEIVEMKASEESMERILRSYRLMLSFYGMTLLDPETGLLARSQEEEASLRPQQGQPRPRSRYRNLSVSSHNNLRISRILKCLSEMGLEHLNAAFLLHVLYEQSSEGQLNAPYLKSSMDRWWANCNRNEGERLFVGQLISDVRTREITLTRKKYEELLERRKRLGSLMWDEPAPADGVVGGNDGSAVAQDAVVDDEKAYEVVNS